jgi:head-tail adaptor
MITDFFDQTITIQHQVSSFDANGELVREYSTDSFTTTLGHIEDISGMERVLQNKERINTTHRMFCPVITLEETDRITYGTSTYEIRHIGNRRNRFLSIDLEVIKVST